MSDPVLIITTVERAASLREHLAAGYLGHTPVEERLRELLADIDRAIAPAPGRPATGHFSS